MKLIFFKNNTLQRFNLDYPFCFKLKMFSFTWTFFSENNFFPIKVKIKSKKKNFFIIPNYDILA